MSTPGGRNVFDLDQAGAPPGTRLESAEEIRRVLQARRPATLKEAVAAPETPPFRPLRRPPMALLCVFDDGSDDGEWFRVREEHTTIGRSEGQIRIPHDHVMSARHAELVREALPGRHRWHLVDLNSTNGVFVRVGGAVLRHGQEMLLGGQRYRFDYPHATAVTEHPPPGPVGTRGWESVSAEDLLPALVELQGNADGRRFFLKQPENWVGSDPAGAAVLADPFVSPRHARIYCDAKARWHVENAGSVNGVWVRVQKIPLDGSCLFQLGEQRFLFKVLL
jgi:pSer/pThr/pTyr-binding forkhead associated (FHA) protein